MSIIDRVRAAAREQSRPTLQSAVGQALPGLLGDAVGGALANGITRGPRGIIESLPDPRTAGPDLVLGQINRQLNQGDAGAERLRQQQREQAAGRNAASGPAGPLAGTPEPQPDLGPPNGTQWTAAPVFGGLSLEQYRRLWAESAMTAKAFKNLFHVRFRDLRPSRFAPAGADGFNLFALDVSFAPCTMPGEAVPVGSANVDNLSASERVEVRITTLDDVRGSIKRWFIGKADQAARADGTFGIPADYLMVLDVTHMATAPTSETDARLTQRWLVRPSNMDNELSRRASELEELQLSFTQWDTFMAVPK